MSTNLPAVCPGRGGPGVPSREQDRWGRAGELVGTAESRGETEAGGGASITSLIHNWVLFFLWLHPFILSGFTSPLISSSILGTYRPGEFLFQCPIFLPFHTVHGVLKARILKWFAIPFSSGPHFVGPFHHDQPVLGGPTWHGLVSLS